MFNHGNKNSLVYWLEFKNDDEFQTIRFGGIGGGSALKFGIYKRKEDGKWITGTPADKKELTVEEAINIARQKRDFLIEGAKVLDAMPDNYEDDTYIKLQEDMTHALGNLIDIGWVHKYFYILFPEKLDDYHARTFQKFYLIKLLQKPIKEESRYAVAGQYIRLARQQNLHTRHFTSAVSEYFGSPHPYWRVEAGFEERKFWKEMLKNSYISIEYPALGDLSRLEFPTATEGRKQLEKLLMKHYPDDPKVIARIAYHLLLFFRYIHINHIIVAVDGQTVMAIGRVIGEYEYREGQDFPNCIKVDWMKIEETGLPNASEGMYKDGSSKLVHEYRDTDNLLAIEKLLIKDIPVASELPETEKTDILTGIIGRIDSILQRKKQVILYGPPGTGKTYQAEKACFELAARKTFHKSYEKLDDNEKVRITGDGQTNGLVRMCCFHSSYAYEDFMEGIKPSVINNQTVFSLKPGIFKKLCDDAQKNPCDNYYLIIDEINRGDISRIFGELITIMEAEKRGKKIILPLSGEIFTVPENVYLIGTMNTADRSIALLDVALRRRFAFIELMPDYNLLADTSIEGIPLGLWLKDLNRRICEHISRDARNLQIGHSYFMEKGKVIKEFDKFRKIIHEDIIPIIEEYCYCDYLTVAKITGDALVDKENQTIRHDIFTSSEKTILITALQQLCPEIATSVMAKAEETEENGIDNEDEAES